MRAFLSTLTALVSFSAIVGGAEELKDLLFTKAHTEIDLRGMEPAPADPTPGLPAESALGEKADLRRLPNLKDGRLRYDALDFLRALHCFKSRPGQVAIYLPAPRVLVLTGTADDHEDTHRYLKEPGFRGFSIRQIEISVSAWTYLDDPAALVNNQAATFERIQAAAGDSLRSIDAHLVVTRSGNRVSSIHQLAAADHVADKAAIPAEGSKDSAANGLPPLKAPGSTLAVEPVIGPDGTTLDFQLEYHARIPQPNAPDLAISITTNASLADGKNLVVQNLQFPPLDGQNPAKIRRYAIVVSAHILDADPSVDLKLSMAEQEKQHRRFITDAFEDLPGFAPRPAPKKDSTP